MRYEKVSFLRERGVVVSCNDVLTLLSSGLRAKPETESRPKLRRILEIFYTHSYYSHLLRSWWSLIIKGFVETARTRTIDTRAHWNASAHTPESLTEIPRIPCEIFGGSFRVIKQSGFQENYFEDKSSNSGTKKNAVSCK